MQRRFWKVRKPNWLKGPTHLLYHILVIVFSAGLALSLPVAATFVAETILTYWSIFQNEKLFLVSIELGLAVFLILFTNYVMRSLRDHRLANMARNAGLLLVTPARGFFTRSLTFSSKEENMKVLIVDDDQEIASIVQTILEDEGFEIRSAMDGEEGFRVFLEFHPDLIITDIQMPRENGIELMKHIRGFNPLVKNIYMSGDLPSFRPLLEEEREKYSVSLLEKPFSRDELMGLVSEVAARRS